jgi:hypothetical protein
MTLIASAIGATSLTGRAPLTERAEGKALDKALVDALNADPEGVTEIEPELWARAGSCAVGPLTAYGRYFAGRPSHVSGYTEAHGVGYICAVTT